MSSRRIAALVGGAALAVVLAVAVAPGVARAEPGSTFRLGYAARAEALVNGPGGAVWFGGFRGDGPYPTAEEVPTGIVGSVSPSGRVNEFETGKDGRLTSIAAGTEGTLWLTEESGDEIVRVTPAGELTYFPLPEPGSEPVAIADGPDGALWFSEAGRDAVGRITTAGQITELPLAAGSEPGAIVRGSDGNLWVAARGADSIDRVTPLGGVTAFPIGGGAKNAPRSLALGPDGNVWFTQTAAARIGRIAPDGSIAEFPLPRPAQLIVSGPDRDLWFTTKTSFARAGFGADGIASITTAGRPSHAVCLGTCANRPAALTRGPDGFLWYGLATPYIEGGGGTFETAQVERGFVGIFKPHRPAIRVGARATVRGGVAEVGLDCRRGAAGERCRGRIELDLGGVAVGAARFGLFTGERTTARARLDAHARRLLAHGGRLRVTPRATSRLIGGRTATITLVATD
jgi:virginiamycin B lyase